MLFVFIIVFFSVKSVVLGLFCLCCCISLFRCLGLLCFWVVCRFACLFVAFWVLLLLFACVLVCWFVGLVVCCVALGVLFWCLFRCVCLCFLLYA